MATVTISSNLSQTARELGVSLSALLKANPQLSNPNIIRAGTQLRVPEQRHQDLSPQESAVQLARVFSNPLVSGASAGSITGVPGTTPPVVSAAVPGSPAFGGSSLPAVTTPSNVAPNVGGFFAPPPLTSTAAQGLAAYQASERGLVPTSAGVVGGRDYRQGDLRPEYVPTLAGGSSTPTGLAKVVGGIGGGIVGAAAGIKANLLRARAGGEFDPILDFATVARGIALGVPQGADVIAGRVESGQPIMIGGPYVPTAEELRARGLTSDNRPIRGAPTRQTDYGWQSGQALLTAASTGRLEARPTYLTTSWAMDFRDIWDTLVPGATTISEFMRGAGYQQLPGSSNWIRMDPTTLSSGLGGGGGGFSGGGGGASGGGGGGGGGGGFASSRSDGEGALYNWHIRITV